MIKWSEENTTGILDIDEQHKTIIETVNGLIEVVNSVRSNEDFWPLVAEIENYISHHFTTEENYMSKYSYPDIIEHTAEHSQFAYDFVKEKEKLRQEEKSKDLLLDFTAFTAQWVVIHYMQADLELIKFLKEKFNKEKI